jgi:hypothetical protein
MNSFVRSLAWLAVLAGTAGSSTAQRPKPVVEPPGQPCHCQGLGASCLFGSAAGCHVTCHPPQRCVCLGAGCFFGFPVPASCSCR